MADALVHVWYCTVLFVSAAALGGFSFFAWERERAAKQRNHAGSGWGPACVVTGMCAIVCVAVALTEFARAGEALIRLVAP